MAKRKGFSKRLRFDVFKRDKFTCQYCGRSAPDIVLEIDHIIPVSKGGDNDITNLVTSCYDCNRGKTDKKLDDDSELKKQKTEMDLRQEKINQRKMLIEWRKNLKDDNEEIKKDVNEYFDIVTGYRIKEDSIFYKENLNKLVESFDFDILCTAIDQGYKTYKNADSVLDKLGGIAFFVQKEKSKPGYRRAHYIFQEFVHNYNIGYVKKAEKERLIDGIIFSLDNHVTQRMHTSLMYALDMKEYTNLMIGKRLSELIDRLEEQYKEKELLFRPKDFENFSKYVKALTGRDE